MLPELMQRRFSSLRLLQTLQHAGALAFSLVFELLKLPSRYVSSSIRACSLSTRLLQAEDVAGLETVRKQCREFCQVSDFQR